MATRNNESGHTGVQVRPNGTVRIRVKYNGEWIWETTDCAETSTGLKRAARLRAQVLTLTKANSDIDWNEFFPGSPRAVAEQQNTEFMPTFDEMADRYLQNCASHDMTSSTIDGYAKSLNRYWRPTIGDDDIDTITLSNLLDAISECTWHSGKTFNNARTPLNGVFKTAARDGYIEMNPVEHIASRAFETNKGRALDVAERQVVLDELAMQSPNWLAYFQVAFGTGMRPSELVGLQWPSVDWRARTILIKEVVVKGKRKNRTKTNVSRTIPITPLAEQGLRHQRALTELAGREVFQNPRTKKAIHDDQAQQKVWRRVTAAVEIEGSVPYSTRHTFATLALRQGVPVVRVSNLLGHKSTKMTLDNYIHALPTDNDREDKLLAEVTS